ncbi:MAG: ferrochelatase, partial [Coriobacteriia bacterium]
DMAELLQKSLQDLGHDIPVAVGMRYWNPFIGDAFAHLVSLGCDRIVTVSLSPFESKVAHGAYREALAEASDAAGGIEIVEAPLVSELEDYVEFFAMATASALDDLQPSDGALVAFTAHSLPESDLVEDDPYVAGLRRVATAIAQRMGMEPGGPAAGTMLGGLDAFGSMLAPRTWFLVYQSQGQRPGGWLGPTVEDLIDAAGATTDYTSIVAVPIGFMTDHMETLYDLDIMAADRALQADLGFVRAAVPNDNERLMNAVAESVSKLI